MNDKLFQYSHSPQKTLTKISEKQVGDILQQSSMDNFTLNQNIENEFKNTLYNSYHSQYLKFIPEPVKYAKKLFEQLNLNYTNSTLPLSQLNMKSFQEKNEKFSISDHEKMDINYKKLLFIVCIIQFLFKQSEKDKNLKDYLSGESPFPQPKEDIKIGGQYYLLSLLDYFGTVKKVNLCLFKYGSSFALEKDSPFIKEAILIFSLFFPIIFEGVMELNIDFNIYPYNNECSIISDHNIPESYNSLIKGSEQYKEIFIANEIIFRSLLSMKRLMRVSITMFDSYQIELNSYLQKELIVTESISRLTQSTSLRGSMTVDVKETQAFSTRKSTMVGIGFEKEKKLENILFYFNELYGQNNDLHIMEMDFHFNSLDPLMFYSINQIINRNEKLINLRITFFNVSKVNINKICLNNFYFEEATKNQKYPTIKETNALLEKIKSNEVDTKLLNLFNMFNKHLKELTISLSYRMKGFNTLYFDFSSSNNSEFQIYLSDDYRIAIIIFLCNILLCLQKDSQEHKVNSFSFIIDDYNQSNIYLFLQLQKQFEECKKGFDLSRTEITLITFAVPNISIILPFNQFPKSTLTYLELQSITLTDFSNLCNDLKNNINLFKVLQTLSLKFDYVNDEELIILNKLFKSFIEDLLIPNIENIIIEFKHPLQREDLYTFIYYVRNSKFHNTKQKAISFEFKICDKDLFESLLEKNKYIKTQESFLKGLDMKNKTRKIRYEQIQQAVRNYSSFDLNIYSNNYMIAIISGMEYIMKRKKIENKKKSDVFKKINKFIGKTIKKKTVHFTSSG